MKAIRTRYIGPTNTKPSRIIASDADGNRVTASVDSIDGKNVADAMRIMAERLRDKMGWRGELVGGGFGAEMFWVFVS